jgi:hypothetical protein
LPRIRAWASRFDKRTRPKYESEFGKILSFSFTLPPRPLPPTFVHGTVCQETLPVSLEEEMRRSYLDYAMSVIVGRALPTCATG